MSPSHGQTVLRILQKRSGAWTLVELNDGRQIRVLDIAWGRDMGDDFDHVTVNVSPGPTDEHPAEFFLTSEGTRVQDEASGRILFDLNADDMQ